jgi:hypothetical protein
MSSFASRIGLSIVLLLATVQTASAYSQYDRWYFTPTTTYSRYFSSTSTTSCPVYDYANPPSGYRFQCTLDVNNCNRCTLQYVGTDSQRCSPASCEGNTTVRTCSNGTILYPVCSRQNDGRCLRVTPECPTDTNPTYSNANYSTNNYYTNQRIFPLPLSNCSTTPPVELPNCQYICSNNDIGRCPICRYSCSSYSTFAAQPLTSPTQSILFPWPDRPHTMPGVGVFSG